MSFKQKLLLVTKIPQFHITQVRNRRKPPWLLPRRAPSKPEEFKKPQPTFADIRNNEVVYEEYNRMLLSISAAFQDELLEQMKKSKGDANKLSYQWNEEEHHKKCIKYNNEENERAAKLRSVREKQNNPEQLIQRMDTKKFQENVNQLIEESNSWITEENLDEKIQTALDVPVNFNFSTNQRGFIHSRKRGTNE